MPPKSKAAPNGGSCENVAPNSKKLPSNLWLSLLQSERPAYTYPPTVIAQMWKRLPRPASSICKEIREETVMPNLVLRISTRREKKGKQKFYMTGIIFLERLLTDRYYVTSAKREVTAEQAL